MAWGVVAVRMQKSSSYPDWIKGLVRHPNFLFPNASRFSCFHSLPIH